MTLRDTLARVARRDPDAPSLRERAAALRASVARTKRSRKTLPEPGSPEALAAFHHACSETDRLMQAARDGYPALARDDGASWTADSLTKALDRGEVTPTAYARLVPLAMEREHRMDAARIATNIDALFALAFAEDYPQAPVHEEPTEPCKPSRIAQLSQYVTHATNDINDGSERWHDDATLNDAADLLARAEFDLFDWPSRDLADLATKMRHAAHYVEAHLRLTTDPDTLDARAWLGLRADIERLARGTPIAGVKRELHDETDDLSRAYPTFTDARGRPHTDLVFSLIEAARHATRRMQDPYPPVTTFEEGEAEDAESERRHDAQEQAYRAVFRVQPTTREGLFALIDYARERADYHLDLVADIAGAKPMPNAPDVLGTIREGVAMLLDGVPEVVTPDQRREA